MNDPNHAAVINQLQLNPLRFCPQEVKVPWTKLMHEQMIKASLGHGSPSLKPRLASLKRL